MIVLAPAATYRPGVVVECAGTEELELLKTLTQEALDKALQEQLAHLFGIWMRDPRDQPARAHAGASHAITAWLGARRGATAFQPPLCP